MAFITATDETGTYTAAEIGKDTVCAHHFKRISPNKIECQFCHMGLYDDPSDPCPIEALNEYYSDPKTIKYNKRL